MARDRMVGRRNVRRHGGELGASFVEFLALGVLAAIIVAGLVATGLPARLSGGMGVVVCRVTGASCGRPEAAGGPGREAPNGGLSQAPQPSSRRPDTPATAHPHPSPNTSPTPGRDVAVRRRTEKTLRETPTGRAALDWVTSHGVKAVYREQRGVYYSEGDNTIYLDDRMPPEELAAYFAHETNHARTRGRPPIDSLSRRAFIDRSVQEEAHGNVLQIKENQELQRRRGPGKVPDTVFQKQYQYAYDYALLVAKNQGRKPTPREKARIGEKAGEQRMVQAIDDGELVAVTDGRSIRDRYGEQWDAAHTKTCISIVCF